jgi:outer membrane protein FlgP
MKKSLAFSMLLLASAMFAQPAVEAAKPTVSGDSNNVVNLTVEEKNVALNKDNVITLTVIGQGVAPESTISPYQALSLAKKAARADALSQLAEKLNGVKVEGYDIVKNMVIQRSQVKTCVSSMIKHANIVETKCAKDFCEVEMELKVVGNKWYSELVAAYK